MAQLSKSDKLDLISSRSRQLEYRKYGLGLDLIVENAKSSPDSNVVDVINTAVAEIDTQLAALNSEFTAVNALTE